MKKNKKIAPSLYSRIKNAKKYQLGDFGLFQNPSQKRPYYSEEKGRYVKENPVGTAVTEEVTEDLTKDFMGDAMGDTMGGGMDVSGGGGGGSASSMIGAVADKLTDDGSDMFYTGAEVATDVGRLVTGDLTALVDMATSMVKRGQARRQDRHQKTIIGDQLTAQHREATKGELETLGETSAGMGGKMDLEEGNLAIHAKKGGMKYNTGGENTTISQDEFNRLGINRYTGALNSEGAYNPDGTFSRDNTDLYGGVRTAPTNKAWTQKGEDMSAWPKMDATKENIVPMRTRMGLKNVPLTQNYNYTDPYKNPKYSDYRKNLINDNNYRKQLMANRQEQMQKNTAERFGSSDVGMSERDQRRMDKFGNTESGFRNFFRNLFSKKKKEGDFGELEGGAEIPIPGSDAVEFKGNRHSQGGIFDGKSEVEHGETKDGVSSAKHGGAQMPYYFSDYVNTDGSKRYGGNSFADAHKELLKEGGNQAEIDALAAAQDKAAGRESKVAGYAQMGNFQNMTAAETVPGTTTIPQYSGTGFTAADRPMPPIPNVPTVTPALAPAPDPRVAMGYQEGDFKNLSKNDQRRLMQDMAGVGLSAKDIMKIMNSQEVKKSMIEDYATNNPIFPEAARQDQTNIGIDHSRIAAETRQSFMDKWNLNEEELKKVDFLTDSGNTRKYQDGDFAGLDYGQRRNIMLEHGFDIGQNWDFGKDTQWYDKEALQQFDTDEPFANMDEVVVTPAMEEARDNTTNTVTQSGNTTAVPTFVNPHSTMDKAGLYASMLAPLAAYTAKSPQMPATGDVSDVERQKLKYQRFDKERSLNESNFQKMVQFIKTSGGGPADMINLMAAHSKKTEADSAVSDKETKHRTEIDNLQAELNMKADTIDVGNELQMKNLKQNADKINVMLRADQQANKISALQTVAANLVTANRDKKAYDAGLLLANAIDGGSGVLGRALSPEELQVEVDKYLKGEGNRSEVDSKKKETTVVTDDDHAGHDHGEELPSFISDSTSFDPNLNVINRLGTEGDPHFGPLASVGMFNLQDSILQEDYADEGFTVTSAMRGIDHSMHRKGSKHSEGNAIDFGVKGKDGKAMMKFFFDDWDGDAMILSEKGRKFLQENNAELIDERTRKGQEHFHLEFNKIDGKERQFYPSGHRTKKGDFLIYGMQQ